MYVGSDRLKRNQRCLRLYEATKEEVVRDWYNGKITLFLSDTFTSALVEQKQFYFELGQANI